MQNEQLSLDMAAKAEALIRCLATEKKSSSSLTRHAVTMAIRDLALAVAKFRLRPVEKHEQDIKPIKRRAAANYKWLGQ